MKKNQNTNINLKTALPASYVLAVLLGGIVFYLCSNIARFGAVLTVFLVIVILALLGALAAASLRITAGKIQGAEEQSAWYRAIIDAISFPVHVTDSDMRWTFMNRAFEKLMIDQGNIKDRDSAYGMACSNAGANICKTENCGIAQLRKGVGQSYFDWCGMSCKQDTSYLVSEQGERIGFVEVVTDLTELIRVNQYNAVEIKRIVDNLNKLAVGSLDLDLSVGEADSYTKESHEQFASVSRSLTEVKGALGLLINDAEMLAQAGVNGALATRADASKHQGSYRTVIQGFNSTLDSIITQIDKTIEVLGKISVNDLEFTMEGNQKGTYQELSDSINAVKGRLLSVEDTFVRFSKGDTSRLEEFKKAGKRSANDRIMPAAIAAMQAIENLIKEANLIAKACVEGRLNFRGQADKFEGGYREIIEGMNDTMDAIERPLAEISDMLAHMADGDFTSEIDHSFSGEYGKIVDAMNHTANSISDVLRNINIAAEQVSTGSSQVSGSSQALSQGATEQASSIEELSASISDIAMQTKLNSTKAVQANDLAVTAKNDAVVGNDQMKLMVKSMEEINESSANISKIIKVIQDIAFQTNILALNAAVEAARAGTAGRGFAVVADEVRNLAAKSADAAKETTMLIEGSIRTVESGTKIANETAEALVKIVTGVEKAAGLVAEIASASNQQATGISQINVGVEQVSQVVQVNSATAEESAAASEELSSQADMLRDMISKFKIKDDFTGSSDPVRRSAPLPAHRPIPVYNKFD
jgi:Methyl-accepting chemotaxis protein